MTFHRAACYFYAARKGIRTGIVAERIGGQVNDTLGIENLRLTALAIWIVQQKKFIISSYKVYLCRLVWFQTQID